MTAEHDRLSAARNQETPWKKWGPYLSERQWGTVREDYSEGGDAWNYFTHDQARSRAYRWGEDGIAGIADDQQRLCFAVALWNGQDSILKERLFGLTNSEGNHGEDVKEYYFYLDSTPTHSYMKYLYKYPQVAFPYADLVQTSRQRGRAEFEYELLDTGAFNENRYFDVFVEYAKTTPEEILVQITVENRGPDTAEIHVLPTLWFRNQWSWHNQAARPSLQQIAATQEGSIVKGVDEELGERYLYCAGAAPLLFTENETNTQRIFGVANPTPYVKDGINNFVVQGQTGAVNPAQTGTKVAPHYRLQIPAGGKQVLQLRLTDAPPTTGGNGKSSLSFGAPFAAAMDGKRRECDEFYQAITPPKLSADEANVMRQALAGMLWSKQFYHYDVDRWLEERGSDPFKPSRKLAPRNDQWHHMFNGDIISMPDKWEYPWYAAWDLAFHVIALTLVDADFGKQQLKLMLRERYMHPNGQIPAYEWNFGDVNPPVHAWATIFTYRLDKGQQGAGDKDWLKSCFQKLLLNFTWWVNRKDRSGRNVFEGGFLGLDNIGVFDRSAPLPTGGYLEQADGTAWMALFCQNMLDIAGELAMTDPDYEDMVLKFTEHFLWIASSMGHVGENCGMWDEEDGFYYDVLRLPNGESQRLKVRSMVGLLPLCAATAFDGVLLRKQPALGKRLLRFLEQRPEIRAAIHDPMQAGVNGRHLASILDETRLRRVLAKMLDENEFLSEFGLRSLSKFHADHPYMFETGGQMYGVGYLPAESDSGMFGGNSNWRGPIWMPVNALVIRALLQYYTFYGDNLQVECPTGSGQMMNLYQVAEEIGRRLGNIFLQNEAGQRAVFGGAEKFQNDPHWRDYLQFYEYFHGDNGAGLGANHQTGWTGIIARIMHLFATLTPAKALAESKQAYFNADTKPRPATESLAGTP
ncbi:Mannosyl oligosaccharide glucosidase [Anatilimnocola aggregata]|uniref:Mannosyl oligosaccharide glucosidase n=1 Tax=Anatilimnocola aggregata TaxID=2528021 RepID=A0A517YA93_9BACT|nr:glucosidase [Anatilimnocola aggregata]QDU27149.1 Mannosyl oligosaccharide glucosidase [Anatilimnocola aggregata]